MKEQSQNFYSINLTWVCGKNIRVLCLCEVSNLRPFDSIFFLSPMVVMKLRPNFFIGDE